VFSDHGHLNNFSKSSLTVNKQANGVLFKLVLKFFQRWDFLVL